MIKLLFIIGIIVAIGLIFVFISISHDCYLLLIIASLLAIVCALGLVTINQRQIYTKETALYNHGIHATDNGKWDLYPVGHKIGTTYVYRCDKCGYSWESNTLYH